MSSNRSARQRLEKIFGKICFIEELGIRNIPKDQRRKIKGYTKYDDVLTYHHIKEKSKGGKTDDDNGALVRGYNHRWLHTLPESEKQKVNNCMLEFKAAVIQSSGKDISVVSKLSMPLELSESDYISIPVYNNTLEDEKKRKKFNRAKEQREFKKLADEGIYLYEHPEENELDDAWYK